MKHTGLFVIVQAALMYLAHGFFFYCFFCIQLSESGNGPAGILVVIGLAVLAVAAACGVAGAILAAVGLKKGMASPTGTTLIVKISLIPWYAMNLYFCVLIFGAMLNPWMMFFIPLQIALSVLTTYLLVVLTGIPDVLYAARAMIEKRVRPSAKLIVGMALQFVFVADVVGAWILFRVFQKADAQARPEDRPG